MTCKRWILVGAGIFMLGSCVWFISLAIAWNRDSSGNGRPVSSADSILLDAGDDRHRRAKSGKHEQDRKLKETIRSLDQSLQALEAGRLVDQATAVRRIKVNPVLRERFKIGDGVEFCDVKVETKLLRRPGREEVREIRSQIDAALAPMVFTDSETVEEIRNQVLKRHLDYEMCFIIVERSEWKDVAGAPVTIVHYHTDEVVRRDQEEGFTLGPKEETTVGEIMGGKEAYARRFGYLFENK